MVPRALFNGLDRHCSAPFVRKRALLLFVGAFAPPSSLRSSIHPRFRLRGFLRAVSRFSVQYCENRSKAQNATIRTRTSQNQSGPQRWAFRVLALVVLVSLTACARRNSAPASQQAPTWHAPASLASVTIPSGSSPGFAWSVAGKATIVTLVGSIHVGFEGLYPLPEPVEKAFRESTTLAMELALDQEPPEQVAELMISGAMLPKGQTLHDCLSEKTWARYQTFAAAHSEQATFFERFRPWFVAVFLSGEQAALDGYDPNQGIDIHFFRQRGARAIIGVEKAAEHVKVLTELPAATQELMLLEQLEAMNRHEDELATLVKLWKKGDADGLALEMFSEFDDPQFAPVYDALIVRRNVRMTQQIETWLAGKEPVFVVLGAGHFVGKDGIVARLQRDGWSPKRL